MSSTLKSFLIGATALAAFGTTATLTAFSATKPDAPQVATPRAKPATVTIKPTPRQTTKRTIVRIRRADRATPLYFDNLQGTLNAPQNNSVSVKVLYYLDYLALRRKRGR